jgi:hypothetical protein
MHEPDFFNNTPFAAGVFPLIDKDGYDCRVVVVKATYCLNEREELADEPRLIRFGDEMWGAPEIADVKYPADLCCHKPDTDFLLVGHAEADSLKRQTSLTLEIEVGNRQFALRVHGDRFWDESLTGVTVTPPAPIETVPLSWSRAWGGFDNSDPDRPVEEPRNPVGRGIVSRPDHLIGKPAPQIEKPSSPINKPGIDNVPAGCAPLGRHFEPRRKWAGTCDDAWLQNVYPARPGDYDPRHENCAPRELVFDRQFTDGEAGEIRGLRPTGPIRFRVPAIRVLIEATIDSQQVERRPHIDTVLIDADASVMELVCRTAFRCPPKMRKRFNQIQIHRKQRI